MIRKPGSSSGEIPLIIVVTMQTFKETNPKPLFLLWRHHIPAIDSRIQQKCPIFKPQLLVRLRGYFMFESISRKSNSSCIPKRHLYSISSLKNLNTPAVLKATCAVQATDDRSSTRCVTSYNICVLLFPRFPRHVPCPDTCWQNGSILLRLFWIVFLD